MSNIGKVLSRNTSTDVLHRTSRLRGVLADLRLLRRSFAPFDNVCERGLRCSARNALSCRIHLQLPQARANQTNYSSRNARVRTRGLRLESIPPFDFANHQRALVDRNAQGIEGQWEDHILLLKLFDNHSCVEKPRLRRRVAVERERRGRHHRPRRFQRCNRVAGCRHSVANKIGRNAIRSGRLRNGNIVRSISGNVEAHLRIDDGSSRDTELYFDVVDMRLVVRFPLCLVNYKLCLARLQLLLVPLDLVFEGPDSGFVRGCSVALGCCNLGLSIRQSEVLVGNLLFAF